MPKRKGLIDKLSYNANGFLWNKQKLYQNRKRNREFDRTLESIPFWDIILDNFNCVQIASYLFVYGLYAQYNDTLLVEAIVAYYLTLKDCPSAINDHNDKALNYKEIDKHNDHGNYAAS